MSEAFDVHDEATLEALGRGLPRVAPPADLFDRILAAVAPEVEAAPVDERAPADRPAPRRRLLRPAWRQQRWLPALAAGLASAAVAVAITVVLEGGGGLGAVSARAAVSGSAQLSGTAELYRPQSPGGELRLVLRHVPAPPPGAHYELWLLPHGTSQMTAVASFTPAGSTVSLILPIPAPGRYAALDISVQPNNGPPTRSTVNLAGGAFSPA